MPPLPPRPDRRRPLAGFVAPPPPPVPRDVELEGEGESGHGAAEAPPSPPDTPAPTTLPTGTRAPALVLDPVAAELISAAINEAVERARAAWGPPSAPSAVPATPVPGKAPSEPPRSSIRVAASGTGTGIKWGTLGLGAVALVGQVIMWTSRPEASGPLSFAFKVIGWWLSARHGEPPPVQ